MQLEGHTALVTGASSGIGACFAKQLAQAGVNLILVARTESVLAQMARDLSQAYGVKVDVVCADLSVEHAAAAVVDEVAARALEIDILVNNAGFATQGSLHTISPQRDHQQVMLNVAAVVDLTHGVLPAMVARQSGVVINVASLGAFQPAPRLAVYGATKAFVLSLSEALAVEQRHNGIRVLALCPGPVDTNFFTALGSREAAIGQRLVPDQVVRSAIKALSGRRAVLVPGWRNRLTSCVVRLIPRSYAARLAGRATRAITP